MVATETLANGLWHGVMVRLSDRASKDLPCKNNMFSKGDRYRKFDHGQKTFIALFLRENTLLQRADRRHVTPGFSLGETHAPTLRVTCRSGSN